MIRGANIDLDRWLWHSRQYFARLGWQAALGGALLIANVLVIYLWLRPMWGDVKEIRAQSEALRITAVQQKTIAHQTDPAAQLAEFYKLFPGSDSIADTLDKVYLAAAENNLALNQGDYDLTHADGDVLQRYEVSFPLRGKYGQVRNFVAKVLADNKNVALVSISFSRNTATDIGINAQVKFILYVKDAA